MRIGDDEELRPPEQVQLCGAHPYPPRAMWSSSDIAEGTKEDRGWRKVVVGLIAAGVRGRRAQASVKSWSCHGARVR